MGETIYEQYSWTREEMVANKRPESLVLDHMRYSLEDLAHITHSRKIFCFGTGKIGKMFVNAMANYSFHGPNLIFVDNDVTKHGTRIKVGDEYEATIINKESMIEGFQKSDYILFTIGMNVSLRDEIEQLIYNLAECEQGEYSNLLFYDAVHERVMRSRYYKGICPICNTETHFIVKGEVPISRYDCLCTKCVSVPRQRALVHAMNRFIPLWQTASIHESSPTPLSAITQYLTEQCKQYTTSQYFAGWNSGDLVEYGEEQMLCQDLGDMSFEDDSFDVFITQDVFEHILKPADAFREIARVLKKGGIHIFTVPWFSENQTTRCRASEINGTIVYHEDKMYHGNPVDETGSLVTNDWGQDLIDFIYKSSGMRTMVYLYENKEMGLEGELLEVFISYK